MNYTSFHALCIGARHVKKNLPCQDFCLSETADAYSLAVVSDGHGHRRHFRSQQGARLACQVARDVIVEFLSHTDHLEDADLERLMPVLKQEICRRWRLAVLKDVSSDPWHLEELEEQKDILTQAELEALEEGEDSLVPYGCTLIAVFSCAWGWCALQVGDGSMAVIQPDGSYLWPMPPSLLNEGNRTASLCAEDPMEDFRHVLGTDHPAGLIVYSDGIEKILPDESSAIVSFLYWVFKNRRFGAEGSMEALTGTLEQMTNQSWIGDDISIAGLINPDAEDAPPKPAPGEKKRQLKQMELRLEEIQQTLAYNRQLLHKAKDPAALEQIQSIICRRSEDAQKLWGEINCLRETLNQPPLPELQLEKPEPPQEPEITPEPDAFNEPEPDACIEEETEPDENQEPTIAPKPPVHIIPEGIVESLENFVESIENLAESIFHRKPPAKKDSTTSVFYWDINKKK